MKPRFILVCVTLLSTAGLVFAAPQGWRRYDGPWFRVYAPPGWKAAPKKQLATEDSAIFTSPDGRAKFTLFSPIWNGAPPEVVLAKKEKLVSKKVSVTKGDHDSTIRTVWMTLRSLDGKWTRSVVDRENTTLNTRLTFGFAYRDQKTYNRYRKTYETFKSTLQQFSD